MADKTVLFNDGFIVVVAKNLRIVSRFVVDTHNNPSLRLEQLAYSLSIVHDYYYISQKLHDYGGKRIKSGLEWGLFLKILLINQGVSAAFLLKGASSLAWLFSHPLHGSTFDMLPSQILPWHV